MSIWRLQLVWFSITFNTKQSDLFLFETIPIQGITLAKNLIPHEGNKE